MRTALRAWAATSAAPARPRQDDPNHGSTTGASTHRSGTSSGAGRTAHGRIVDTRRAIRRTVWRQEWSG
ncbi:MAG: hypothetical protein ACKO91_12475 [Acidimicrobiales bacterium]